MPARAGAGAPPTDLRQVIGNGPRGDETVIDRVEGVLRLGGFMKDAAARCGVSIETLRRWIALGNRCARELNDPDGRTLSRMKKHERDCVDLARRVEAAEADSRMGMLLLVHKEAVGGYEKVETVERVNAAGQVVETTRKTSTAAPNGSMATWWLMHRHPEDFARTRVEVTGAGGGPVEVNVTNVVDKLKERLAEVRSMAAGSDPASIEAAIAAAASGHGNGNGTNGNGDHP